MQTETSVINLNTSLIIPNKYQPRKVFDEKSLINLENSIKEYGIINPILVRKKEDKYEIIAGERRYRAAKNIGLTEVPVIVKNADEQQMAELALIENIQRQGLSPIEEAKSYEEIIRIGNQTQASLAQKIGKSQSAIANKIRLLSLPPEVQDALSHQKISERHARSLINVTNKEKQLELLNRIITEKLTVKETEQIINEKEINEDEIKQAISDIMKSLNIKEEEKDDENMNNGNFFPNYDNNNAANNNATLNMMNMQSMNQPPMMNPEPEVVMPTPVAPIIEPQLVVPQAPVGPMAMQPPMEPTVPVLDPVAPLGQAQQAQVTPEVAQPMINDAPLFGPELVVPQAPVEPSSPAPAMDVPLFNPSVTMPGPMENIAPIEQPQEVIMPIVEQPIAAPSMEIPQQPVMPSFEIPVTEPQIEIPAIEDKLNNLKEILNANGYTYKVYSSDTDNCVIIEFPKN